MTLRRSESFFRKNNGGVGSGAKPVGLSANVVIRQSEVSSSNAVSRNKNGSKKKTKQKKGVVGDPLDEAPERTRALRAVEWYLGRFNHDSEEEGVKRTKARAYKKFKIGWRLFGEALREVKSLPENATPEEQKQMEDRFNVVKKGAPRIFSDEQEKIIKRFVVMHHHLGCAMTKRDVSDLAASLWVDLERRGEINVTEEKVCPTFSDRWVDGFLERNKDIELRAGHKIDHKKIAVINRGTFDSFYNLMESIEAQCKEDGVQPVYYNTDEVGVSVTVKEKASTLHVFDRRTSPFIGAKATPLHTVSIHLATRYDPATKHAAVMPSLATYKATGTVSRINNRAPKELKLSSDAESVLETYLQPDRKPHYNILGGWLNVGTVNGWTNAYTFSEHLNQLKPKFLEDLNNNKRPILLMDGVAHHANEEFFNWAKEKRMEVVYIPPNSSHILQPNDRSTNAGLKNKLKVYLNAHTGNGKSVCNSRIMELTLLAASNLSFQEVRRGYYLIDKEVTMGSKSGFKNISTANGEKYKVQKELLETRAKPFIDAIAPVVNAVDETEELRALYHHLLTSSESNNVTLDPKSYIQKLPEVCKTNAQKFFKLNNSIQKRYGKVNDNKKKYDEALKVVEGINLRNKAQKAALDDLVKCVKEMHLLFTSDVKVLGAITSAITKVLKAEVQKPAEASSPTHSRVRPQPEEKKDELPMQQEPLQHANPGELQDSAEVNPGDATVVNVEEQKHDISTDVDSDDDDCQILTKKLFKGVRLDEEAMAELSSDDEESFALMNLAEAAQQDTEQSPSDPPASNTSKAKRRSTERKQQDKEQKKVKKTPLKSRPKLRRRTARRRHDNDSPPSSRDPGQQPAPPRRTSRRKRENEPRGGENAPPSATNIPTKRTKVDAPPFTASGNDISTRKTSQPRVSSDRTTRLRRRSKR